MALRKNGKMKHAITPLSSTNTTFFYKRIFPVLFFGFVAMLFVVGLVRVIDSDPILYLPFVIVPVLMGIFSYQYMKKFSFNLVDEVLDVGDALIVRRRARRTHRTRRHHERQLCSLRKPVAGHIVAAAAERVRRHNSILRPHPLHAAFVRPNHRKTDPPHRCRTPGCRAIGKTLTENSKRRRLE